MTFKKGDYVRVVATEGTALWDDCVGTIVQIAAKKDIHGMVQVRDLGRRWSYPIPKRYLRPLTPLEILAMQAE